MSRSMRDRTFLAVLVLAQSIACEPPPAPVVAPTSEDPPIASLDRAMADFGAAIRETRVAVQSDPAYSGNPSGNQQRAAGALYWAQMILRTMEEDLLQDRDFPFFRVVDQRIREGADNPDQRYLFARIRGGVPYRIWGQKIGERRIEVQVYAGLPWVSSEGRVASILTDEDLVVSADGRFEIRIGGEPGGENWIENPADATMVMVRQIHGDWSDDVGHVHIDRVGFEGLAKPALTEALMAARLERAAANLRKVVPLWPRFGRERYAQAEPNRLTPPWDPGSGGGVVGRWMSIGSFRIEEGEALILTTWPASGNYQGVQLTDLWTSSLEYANRQTSLTGDQARLDSDGAYRMVISHDDPGIQNWLDTTGLRRGYILLRYDGTGGDAIPEQHWPRLEKVRIDALRDHLPADTPGFTAEQRREALAARRRHVQRRFGI